MSVYFSRLVHALAVVFKSVDCCCVRNWNITRAEEFYFTASFRHLVCCTFLICSTRRSRTKKR